MKKELSHGGKLPPQAIDLEEAVLGAILLERGTIDKVVSLLEPNDFYLQAHKEIYKSILSLYNEKNDIDILTVTNGEIKKELELFLYNSGIDSRPMFYDITKHKHLSFLFLSFKKKT